MKNLLRILTVMLLIMAAPIAIFMFFPKMAEWVNQQPWNQNLWMFLIGAGILALFIGLDLLNRVDVYKAFVNTPEAEKEEFWQKSFVKHRLGFLRSGVISLLLLAIVLFAMVFYLMILPKAPEGNWHLWVIKVLGVAIGIGVLTVLNAVMFLTNGRKVILGVDEKPVLGANEKREPTWVDKMFQIKPTFLDADVDLKEDFDGISELDNPPPPWFMWLFYSTVVFAGVYLVRYTWMHYAPGQIEEYNADMKQIMAMKAKAAGNVDENNVTIETDKEKLAEAASIFKEKCAVCHGEKAEGKNGPNLTDDNWIHGNSAKEVFKTIKYGVLEKGMVAWKDQISPVKMKALTTYILTLRGTNPAGAKAPEGEKMEPKEKI
jgi:cytochrome c oxidase cbb3-type subunit 3